MRNVVRLALTTILEEAVTVCIGAAPYAQNLTRRDYRHGSYPRDLATGVGRIADLAVSRMRRGFRTHVFARAQRRRPEVDTCRSEMFVRGVSRRAGGAVLEHRTGVEPSPSTVARIFHKREDEFNVWKQRNLAAHYVYCFAFTQDLTHCRIMSPQFTHS